MPQKRVVGFLDILGFKNKLDSTPLDELSASYEQLAGQARAMSRPLTHDESQPTLFRGRQPNKPWCIQHIFSDSIILVANDDTDTACLELLVYTWRLTQVFLAAGMPLRGGIEYDEMYCNPETGIFIGKALTKAYHLESSQDWLGTSISDAIWEKYTELATLARNKDLIFSTLFKRYPVPMKSGSTSLLHTINWRYNYVVEKGTRSLFSDSADVDVRRKVDNTLQYSKSVIDVGIVYQKDNSNPPIELQTMWVGGREPPFPHGDDL